MVNAVIANQHEDSSRGEINISLNKNVEQANRLSIESKGFNR